MSSPDCPGNPAPRSDGAGRDAGAAGRDECTAGANWYSGLAYALTGQWLDISVVEEPEIDRLLAELERCGWDWTRLAEAARHPRALPPGWARQFGAARFAAVLGDLRRRLAAPCAEARISALDRPLDADEQRLVGDRPPHWG